MPVTEQDVLSALRSCYDPEIPVNIVDLGLIYKVGFAPAVNDPVINQQSEDRRNHDQQDDKQDVTVEMTLTAPACPVAGEMPVWVENAVGAVAGVAGVKVNMVFDPPWDQSRMSDEARVALDMW